MTKAVTLPAEPTADHYEHLAAAFLAAGGYSHTRIYADQTGDLSTRFDNHHKQACFDRHSKNCVCVHGEQDEDTRLAIEQDLIDNYDPPCNGD